MKKRFFLVVIGILFFYPLWSFLLWVLTPEKVLNILILDKTVLDTKTQEHISLSWIIKHDKYANSKTGRYIPKRDYFGLFPNDKGSYQIKDFNHLPIHIIDSLVNSYQIAYYTDLYGIYEGEWYEKYPDISPYKKYGIDNSMEHTRRFYGGMTQKELYFLQKMKTQKKLILTEFNVIATPTPNYIRREFENEFGVIWSGWVGRYYESLDTVINKELPRWMKRNYLAQHNNEWPFKKSGIVFVREDDKIEILEKETHLDVQIPIIYTNEEYMLKYELPAEMKYPFWFDIMSSTSKNRVVSTYKITANRIGKKLLHVYGIPDSFPAVIEHDSDNYKFYYFAGDFCDNPIRLNSAKFIWIENLSVFFYERAYQERISFFWDFYRPMVRKIIKKYYKFSSKTVQK